MRTCLFDVVPLEAQNLEMVAGAAVLCPKESNQICSIQLTCVSCVYTADTRA